MKIDFFDKDINADELKRLYKVENLTIEKLIKLSNNYNIYILANKKEIEEIEKM